MAFVECKPIGILTMIDSGLPDDKIIAVAVSDPFYKNYNDINVKFVKNNNYHLVKKYNSIKCFEPYRDIVLDSKGPMRPCVGCHDWLGDSSKLSINDFWNCEGMQFFRKKFSTGHLCSIAYKASDNGPNDTVSCSDENCWSW